MPTGPELTAVAKILSKDHKAEYIASWEGIPYKYEPPTVRDVSKLALEAAEVAREKGAKFVTVGRIMLPGGEWHNFALGPFSTILQAQRAGEGFTHDPKTGTGTGEYRAVPLVNKPLDAFNAIRPDQVDHIEWIKDQIRTGLTGLSDPDVYRERGNW